jgi:hypothetical protein
MSCLAGGRTVWAVEMIDPFTESSFRIARSGACVTIHCSVTIACWNDTQKTAAPV